MVGGGLLRAGLDWANSSHLASVRLLGCANQRALAVSKYAFTGCPPNGTCLPLCAVALFDRVSKQELGTSVPNLIENGLAPYDVESIRGSVAGARGRRRRQGGGGEVPVV